LCTNAAPNDYLNNQKTDTTFQAALVRKGHRRQALSVELTFAIQRGNTLPKRIT